MIYCSAQNLVSLEGPGQNSLCLGQYFAGQLGTGISVTTPTVLSVLKVRGCLDSYHRVVESHELVETARAGMLSQQTQNRIQDLKKLIFMAGGPRAEIEVLMPFLGTPIGTLPRGEPRDIHAAVAAARQAQPAWHALGVKARAQILSRFHDLVLERQEEILTLCQLEIGKARRHALEELLDTAIVARYYAYHSERFLKPKRRKGAMPLFTKTIEYRQPVGVVGVVVPWNYPINLAVTDALPALVAGNTVVLKPDHQVSFTALALIELLYEAGVPRQVCPVVTGLGPELGPPLIDAVDFVMYTGSSRTGRMVAEQAGRRLIGCSLELGGKNPMLVLKDADVKKAAAGAVNGAFVGAGQVCVSIERIYVHSSVFEEFLNEMSKRTARLRLGTALTYESDMGSLASDRQLKTVSEHVEDARSKGAQVVTGGRSRPDLGPYFYEPTILVNVQPGMLPFADETFGPVVSLYKFDTVEEAIQLANATRYGLNAAVWSKDTCAALEVAKRIQAGTVNINETYAATWASVDAPIGGMKESGFSRRHGQEGLLKYTEAQTVSIQRGWPISGPQGWDRAQYAKAMITFLKILKRLPGLR